MQELAKLFLRFVVIFKQVLAVALVKSHVPSPNLRQTLVKRIAELHFGLSNLIVHGIVGRWIIHWLRLQALQLAGIRIFEVVLTARIQRLSEQDLVLEQLVLEYFFVVLLLDIPVAA